MSGEIHYSRGKSKFDNKPQQRTVRDFDAFQAAVLNDRAKRKGEQYVCAPFKESVNDKGETNHFRRGAHVELCRFIPFDFDGFSNPEHWHATVEALHKTRAFAYTTASHTPSTPRARAVLEANRPMTRTERMRVCLALEKWIESEVGEGCITFDRTVYRSDQPLYCPPLNAETFDFRGAVVDVDEWLARAPESDEGPSAQQRAERIEHDDPVYQRLLERSMILGHIDPKTGKIAVTCPFASTHTAQTGNSSTVYMLANYGGYRYGQFICLHSHCEGRKQEDYLKSLGLDPYAVWREQRGEKPKDPPPATAPEPLFVSEVPPIEYPVDALGPILAGAAVAMHEEVQAPLALCGQSVLAAAAMCAQGHINVQPPHGRPHPIALYALTVADSGDRKTETDRIAKEPINERERELERDWEDQQTEYNNKVHVYEEARKAAITRTKKAGQQAMFQALSELKPPGDPPPKPYLIAEDPTVEGIYRAFKEGHPSQGCFTAEAGLMIGGHAMNPDNFLKTITRLSSLWDGGSFDRTRGGDERGKLHRRRFSLHWLVQPTVAAELFEKRIAEHQGFFPRCLLAIPDTLAGNRPYRGTDADKRREIGAYWKALTSLLREPMPLDEKGKGLMPKAVVMTDDAKARYAEFYNHYEFKNGPKGELGHLQPFVSRIAEHGARIAGIRHVVDRGVNPPPIDLDTLNGGFRLAEYNLREWDRLKVHAAASTEMRNAKMLLQWAHEQPTHEDGDRYVYSSAILQFGPNPTRERNAMEDAVKILTDHGWFVTVKEGKVLDGRARKKVWKVASDA